RNNRVDNYSTQSSAVMSGSASGAEGNIGINVAGGDLNQQKNRSICSDNSTAGIVRVCQ
ncbi:MAG: heme utilization protein, partial [Ignavibacterium sp.]